MVMVRCARRAFAKKSTVAKGVTAQAAREAFHVHDETRVGRKTPRLPIFSKILSSERYKKCANLVDLEKC